MSGLRYTEVREKERKFLDLTSLTVEVFDQLVPSFEEAFQERMKEWCLEGKKRIGRAYTSYANSPLPTPEDRLLFILVYLKTNPLQVVQGQLFGLPQNKANQWIHALLPVLQQALRKLGDTPARSMEELAQQLNLHTEAGSPVGPEELSAMMTKALEPEEQSMVKVSSTSSEEQSMVKVSSTSSEEQDMVKASSMSSEEQSSKNSPLFATMALSDGSNAPKMRMNRKAIIAARKNVTR